ncbi:MAG: tape measure protein [Gammaproteobacteria bacterium]|nr:tape measure protein [Gammaproteobacteria bacterium]
MADIATIGLEVDSRGVVKATKNLGKLEKQGSRTERSTLSLKGAFSALGAAVAAVGFVNLAKSTVRATASIDGINSSLRVATGSAEGAADELQFVRNEAERLGLELETSAGAFASLAAAANNTTLAGEGARNIFVAISEAMTALGRDATATEGALKAVEQMISKGSVSAEELRGQLGERLPGAFQIAARSMGVTTQELDKMLRNGEVLASDLLPRLATELSNTFSSEAENRAHGLQAEMNRFDTAVFNLMSSGNMEGLASSIREISDVISDPTFQSGFSTFITGLGQTASFAITKFVELGKQIGEGLARSIHGPIEGTLKEIEREIDLTEKRLAHLNKEFEQPRLARLNPFRGEESYLNELNSLYNRLDDLEKKKQSINSVPLELAKETTAQKKKIPLLKINADEFGPVIKFGEPEKLTERNLILERYNELLEESDRIAEQVKSPQELFQEEIRLLNELRDTTHKVTGERLLSEEQYTRAVEQAQERMANSTEETMDKMTQFAQQAANNMQDAFADGFFDLFTGKTNDLAETFSNMLQRMAADLAASSLLNFLVGDFGGSGQLGGIIGDAVSSFGGFRADGGPVSPGKSFIVGERGPELFTPRSSGQIIPNGASSGGSVSVMVNVDASGSSVEGDDQQSNQLGRLIGASVRSVIIEERRPGGLLS